MAFLATIGITGPIMLIFGITQAAKVDTTFWVVAGAMITFLDLIFIIYLMFTKKKGNAKKADPRRGADGGGC